MTGIDAEETGRRKLEGKEDRAALRSIRRVGDRKVRRIDCTEHRQLPHRVIMKKGGRGGGGDREMDGPEPCKIIGNV